MYELDTGGYRTSPSWIPFETDYSDWSSPVVTTTPMTTLQFLEQHHLPYLEGRIIEAIMNWHYGANSDELEYAQELIQQLINFHSHENDPQ